LVGGTQGKKKAKRRMETGCAKKSELQIPGLRGLDARHRHVGLSFIERGWEKKAITNWENLSSPASLNVPYEGSWRRKTGEKRAEEENK